jgi:hypothetical protein
VKATRLALILAVGSAVGGSCYLAVRHYENTIAQRSYYFDHFELPNPCRPTWLYAAKTNARPSDGSIQKKLTGTWWHCEDPYYMGDRMIWTLSRLTVASNGGYVCHIASNLYPHGHTNVIQGYWQVKDGVLFDTITNYIFRTTNEPALHVFSNQVLRITGRELAYRSCEDGPPVLFRRVRQLNR